MNTLRILIVGGSERLQTVTDALAQAGHDILPVDHLQDASEALLIQRFDVVLLGDLAPEQVLRFSAEVRDLERRSNSPARTAVLSVLPGAAMAPEPANGIDGYLSASGDPDVLTLAISRLASAVGTGSTPASPLSEAEQLPVLDVDQLKEQVAYDDELLVELIDLFLSERIKQVKEMREAFAEGKFEQLSRIAHTIKGSLSSLHAMATRYDAQALELAAREHDAPKCQGFLASLEEGLDLLEGRLLNLRKSVSSS